MSNMLWGYKRGTEKLWVLKLTWRWSEGRAELVLHGRALATQVVSRTETPCVSKTRAKLDKYSGDWPDSSQEVSWTSRNRDGNLGWMRQGPGQEDGDFALTLLRHRRRDTQTFLTTSGVS